MRVPLIIAGKSIAPGAHSTNALAYVTDITPTIVNLAGVNPPSGRFGPQILPGLLSLIVLVPFYILYRSRHRRG